MSRDRSESLVPEGPVEQQPGVEIAPTERAAIGGLERSEAAIATSVVGGVRAGHVELERSVVGGVAAGEVSIRQGFAQGVAAGNVHLEQSGARSIVAGSVTMGGRSGAVLVLAGRVDGEARSVLDTRAGLVLVGLLALLALLVRSGRRSAG